MIDDDVFTPEEDRWVYRVIIRAALELYERNPCRCVARFCAEEIARCGDILAEVPAKVRVPA